MATLQCVGTNIEELMLHGDPINPASNHAHLRYAPNPSSLSLIHLSQFNRSGHPIQWTRILVLFEPLLNSEGNISPLEHLTNYLLRLTGTLNPHYWNQWSAFDTLLGKPKFASLETVDFELVPYPGPQIFPMVFASCSVRSFRFWRDRGSW
ncbi:hypothetical protein BT96DRAFT_450018 [Gymnopus androsaceus JB14]|uniref:Uncharacterized protein n=1 Tax=Gymnopus androsaceus JB14 TaxID=1447944 RepID=A0A6A4GS10_9AGAR|nr:hypothetical protein BT96DRAFT_450018 [Gymnopus androsaceus JB14]